MDRSGSCAHTVPDWRFGYVGCCGNDPFRVRCSPFWQGVPLFGLVRHLQSTSSSLLTCRRTICRNAKLIVIAFNEALCSRICIPAHSAMVLVVNDKTYHIEVKCEGSLF